MEIDALILGAGVQSQFGTILADPPWPQSLAGKRTRTKGGFAAALPYPTMSIDEISNMSVANLARDDCHCWLWTTNALLEAGFHVLHKWGFKYLAPIHWIKPSGAGNYVIHRTQTLLLGYREKCIFSKKRYFPNVIVTGNPVRHSQKPNAFYALIEEVSHEPRLELFARHSRLGWTTWGNEVPASLR